MMNEIRQYIRKNHRRVGVMVAIKDENGVHVGWSKCHINKDRFSRERGIMIARTRAVDGSRKDVPSMIQNDIQQFIFRASRYFKSDEVKLQGK